MSPELAAIADLLKQKMADAQKTAFHPVRGNQDPNSCLTAMGRWGGYWGPWVGPLGGSAAV